MTPIDVLIMSQNLFFNRRTLIIGSGSAGSKAAQLLAEYGPGKYRSIGFVDDDPAKEGTTVHIEMGNLPEFKVLGNRHALPELIAQHRVSTGMKLGPSP